VLNVARRAIQRKGKWRAWRIKSARDCRRERRIVAVIFANAFLISADLSPACLLRSAYFECRLSSRYLNTKSTLIPRIIFLTRINNELLRGEITVIICFHLCIRCEIRGEQIKDAVMIIGISLVLQSSLPLKQYGSPISARLFESISEIFPRPTFRIALNAPV